MDDEKVVSEIEGDDLQVDSKVIGGQPNEPHGLVWFLQNCWVAVVHDVEGVPVAYPVLACGLGEPHRPTFIMRHTIANWK